MRYFVDRFDRWNITGWMCCFVDFVCLFFMPFHSSH